MWTANDIPSQTGKTIVVTGGTSGIGYETALALYLAGANVTIASRDERKIQQAIERIERHEGGGTVEAGIIDLARLDSVREFAETFAAHHDRLDVLINNAGVGTPPAALTADGYESQFGINFLGHFALTGRVYPLLRATPGARVVTVSSFGYLTGAIDFDNFKLEKDYDAAREYGQSKLADLMFAIDLDRRVKALGQSVVSVAAQPGANNTDLTRHSSEEAVAAMKARFGGFMDPWQGALPTLYAAVADDATGGNMYEPDEDGFKGYPTMATIQAHALDEAVAARLWDVAQDATGIVFPA